MDPRTPRHPRHRGRRRPDDRRVAAQTGRFLGFAWLAFQALSHIKIHGITVIEWAGILTPGGETRTDYTPRHAAAPEGEPHSS